MVATFYASRKGQATEPPCVSMRFSLDGAPRMLTHCGSVAAKSFRLLDFCDAPLQRRAEFWRTRRVPIEGKREGSLTGSVLQLLETPCQANGLTFDDLSFQHDGVGAIRLQAAGDDALSGRPPPVEHIRRAADLRQRVRGRATPGLLVRIPDISVQDLHNIPPGQCGGDEVLIE